MKEPRPPALGIFPGDWFKDLRLQDCSLEARGLWLELLLLMHEANPYGHLAIDGEAMRDEQVARRVGVPVERYRDLLAELERRSVSYRTADGILYSKRMVQDHEVRMGRQQGGKQRQEQRRQQSGSIAPATERKGTSVDVLEGGAGGNRVNRLVSRIRGHVDRDAIVEFFDHLPPKADVDYWAGILSNCLDGLGLAEGKAASIEALAQCCRDFPGIPNNPWNPRFFRRCVESSIREAKRPVKGDRVSNAVDAAQRWAKGGNAA